MNGIPRKGRYLFWVAAYLCTILYILFQWVGATSFGAGLSPDSIIYINNAQSIIENKNLAGMGGHRGPLYPIFLACVSYFNGDILVAAKWGQAVLLAANIFLLGFVIFSSTGKSLNSLMTGFFVVATSLAFLEVHSMVWSEPLFLFLALAGLYFLSLFMEQVDNRLYLVVSALLVGLAIVTRVAGLSLLITACLGLVLFGDHGLKKRVLDISLFFLISLVPLFFWAVNQVLLNNGENKYCLYMNRIPVQEFLDGSKEILFWFLLPVDKTYFILVLFLIILGLLIISIRKSLVKPSSRLCEISLINTAVYLVFIVFSKVFVFANIPFDRRILFPAYYFLFLGIVLLANRVTAIKQPISWIGYLLLAYLLVVGSFQVKTQNRFVEYAQDGIMYAHKEWVQSEVIDWINKNKIDTLLYTNGPDPLSVYTNVKNIKMIPRLASTKTRQRNENIMQELNAMVKELSENAGYIVMFPYLEERRWYLPTEEQLLQVLPMELILKGRDGAVYAIKK